MSREIRWTNANSAMELRFAQSIDSALRGMTGFDASSTGALLVIVTFVISGALRIPHYRLNCCITAIQQLCTVRIDNYFYTYVFSCIFRDYQQSYRADSDRSTSWPVPCWVLCIPDLRCTCSTVHTDLDMPRWRMRVRMDIRRLRCTPVCHEEPLLNLKFVILYM